MWSIRLLALVAMGLSGYLILVTMDPTNTAGCVIGEMLDCRVVLSSSWAKILELPVAGFGVGCYGAIFLFSWLAGVRHPRMARWGVGLVTLLTTAAAAAAVWFIVVQLIWIGSYCPLCLLVHCCGLVMAVLLAIGLSISCSRAREDAKPVTHLQSALAVGASRPRPPAPRSAVTGPSQFALPVVIGLASVGCIAATQLMFPGQTSEVAQAGDLGGEIDLDAPGQPVPANPTNGNPPDAHVVHRPAQQLQPPLEENAPAGFENAGENPSTDQDELAATGTFEDTNDDASLTDDDTSDIDVSNVGDLPSRTVSVYNDQIKFDIYKQAYFGSPEASHVIVELFDYTCAHCRKTHEMLLKANRRYGNNLAVVVMPIPMEASCNPLIRTARPQNRGSCKLSRLALAVAKVRPSRFNRFHNWLMADKDNAPQYGSALVRAYRDFNRNRIRNELSKETLDEKLQRNVNLYANLANRWEGEKGLGLPVLILGDKISSGGFEFDDELYNLLEESFDIQRGF